VIPLTTRLEIVAKEGLTPVLKRLLGKGIPGIVLEAPDAEHALAVDAAALRQMRAPVVGAIAPLGVAPKDLATVASGDAGEAEAAASAIVATAAAVAPLGVRSVIAVVGAAGLPEKGDLRGARERRAGEVCRALHGVAKSIAPQRLLLLPGPDPLGLLDAECAEWVLDDLGALGVGLALDTGWAWAAEVRGGTKLAVWLERHAFRLGFLLISDHDSGGCGEVLPGAGRGDLAVLRGAIGKRTPRALRPDPRASLDDVLASVEFVARHLGAVGDVVGW
jgi:sugar phosphate isomerase/epimerase